MIKNLYKLPKSIVKPRITTVFSIPKASPPLTRRIHVASRQIPRKVVRINTFQRHFSSTSPFSSVADKVLESCLQPANDTTILSFDELDYHLDAGARQLLEAQARTYLYAPGQLHAPVNRNLVLSSPHPGAVYMMDSVVKALGKELDADVLMLDYLDIVRMAQHMDPIPSSKNLFKKKKSSRDINLPIAQAFRPSDYAKATLREEEEERDEEEESSREEEEEEEEPEEDEEDSPPHIPSWQRSTRSKDKLVKKLTLTIEATPTLPPLQTAPLVSHYHYQMPVEHIMAFKQHLTTFLKSRKRPTIVWIKDVNDFFPEGPKESQGSVKLIYHLLDAVSQARNQGVSTMLICGASPSVLDLRPEGMTDPDSYTRDAAIAEDAEFWRRVCSESSDSEVTMKLMKDYHISGEEGPYTTQSFLYQHCLSKMPHIFSTVPLASPSPPHHSLSTSRVILTPDDAKENQRQDEFIKWHGDMQRDHALRIRELNWRNTLALCNDRNVVVDEESCEALLLPNPQDTTVSNVLERQIWRMDVIEKWVDTAIGLHLKSQGNSMILTMNDFVNAIQVLESVDPSVKPLIPEEEDTETQSKDTVLASIAETVDNAEDEAAEPETQAEMVNKLVKARKLKLNTYEKRLLGCVVDPNSIPVTFKDLVLPPSTKLALQTSTTLPLLRPDLFSHGILKKSNFSGVLLFGPPGTGKTMLAKCVARSGGARFLNVSLSDVFDKYVGEGEKNVKAIFTLARKIAPCVVFVDEVDALFGRRRSDGFTSRREVINEFMSHWDGLTSDNGNVMVVAATNRPFDLDDAVLRRMPRRILVDLPTESARLKILELNLKDEILVGVDLADLAKKTILYSGSDLRNLCIAAALTSVKENVVREAKFKLPPLLDPNQEDAGQRAQIFKDMENVDDWADLLNLEDAPVQGTGKRILTKEHFDVALKEVPASLTDSTETLKELRKWDMEYGSRAHANQGKKAWGFA